MGTILENWYLSWKKNMLIFGKKIICLVSLFWKIDNPYHHNFDIAEDKNLDQAHKTMNSFDTVLIESNEENEENTEMLSEISSDPLALNEPMIEHQEMIFDSSDTESSSSQNYDAKGQ